MLTHNDTITADRVLNFKDGTDKEIARLLLEAADLAAEGAVDTARSRVLAAAATAAAAAALGGYEADRYGAILGMAQKLATTFA